METENPLWRPLTGAAGRRRWSDRFQMFFLCLVPKSHHLGAHFGGRRAFEQLPNSEDLASELTVVSIQPLAHDAGLIPAVCNRLRFGYLVSLSLTCV